MEILVPVIVALITGGFSILAVVLTNTHANNKMHNEMTTAQAVTKEQIKELTREVRTHNDFATRIPLLEQEIINLKARVASLEEYHKQQP
jgi:Zn-dependent M32 family carboxypeptidase